MPTVPHIEKHFTASETVRDVVIGIPIVSGMPVQVRLVPSASKRGRSAAPSRIFTQTDSISRTKDFVAGVGRT